jgi:hypothetical protein
MSKKSSVIINQPIGCINFWEATKVYDDLGALYFVLGNDGFILWASASFIEYWDSASPSFIDEAGFVVPEREMSESDNDMSESDNEEMSESKSDTDSDSDSNTNSEETETEDDEWYGGWYGEYNGDGLGSGEV